MTSRQSTTDEIIATLVHDLRPLPRGTVSTRLTVGMMAGGVLALFLVISLLGVRPDLASAARSEAMWSKTLYTLVFSVVSVLAVSKLARPDGRSDVLWLLPVPLLMYLPVVGREIATASGHNWLPLLLGHGWQECTWMIIALSVPVFGGLLWAFKKFAPSRPRVAGAVSGLCASSVAGVVYGLHCPANTALFVLVWYTLAFAIAAALGAWVGERLLRW